MNRNEVEQNEMVAAFEAINDEIVAVSIEMGENVIRQTVAFERARQFRADAVAGVSNSWRGWA